MFYPQSTRTPGAGFVGSPQFRGQQWWDPPIISSSLCAKTVSTLESAQDPSSLMAKLSPIRESLRVGSVCLLGCVSLSKVSTFGAGAALPPSGYLGYAV